MRNRAIVFDLDDTLYPRQQFLDSGFAAVADDVARRFGVSALAVRRHLVRASRIDQGSELQEICARFGVPLDQIPRLVTIIRRHQPALRLPAVSRRVLASLRRTWRIGVLTNGLPAVQRRKVAALGLRPLVDTIVYAAECEGGEKPNPRAFHRVLARLKVEPSLAIMVGDDAWADIAGGSRAGLRTIHLCGDRSTAPVRPDAVVRALRDVPLVANALLEMTKS